MKLKTIEKISCLIPGYSTIFILVVSLVTLSRRKVSPKMWLRLIAIAVAFMSVHFSVVSLLLAKQAPMVRILASAVIFTPMNLLLIDLQSKCNAQASNSQKRKTSLSKKRNVVLIIGGYSLLVFLAFFAVFFTFTASEVHYEDLNGERDTSLSIITMEDIGSTQNDYSATWVETSHSGEQTNVEGRLRNCDYDKCVFRCKQISGVLTLQATNTESETLILDIVSTVELGNLEIHIFVDDQYFSQVNTNGIQTITLEDIANKTVTIKIAAESAQIDVTVERTYI